MDYDDLAIGVHLADSLSSNAPDAGLVYDTGVFTRYPGDKRELEYVPPTIGELPLREIRLKRERIPDEDGDANDASIDVHKDFFASLFAFIRPERGVDSTDPQKVPLHGLVHAVESTLLNSANAANEQHVNDLAKASSTTTTTPTTETTTVVNPKKRAIEILSTAKTDDVDELTDKDYKFDVDVKRSRNQDLSFLAPIAFTAQKDEKQTVQSTSTASTTDEASSAESTTSSDSNPAEKSIDAPNPAQQTNITVIKTSNTTHVVPNGDVTHVQHQHIQHSIFQSNLAFLPTIPSHKLDIPSSTPEASDDDIEPCNDDSSSSEESSEEDKDNKKKCRSIAKAESTTITAENREELLKKVQILKEQIAEIEAEPVILTQGV